MSEEVVVGVVSVEADSDVVLDSEVGPATIPGVGVGLSSDPPPGIPGPPGLSGHRRPTHGTGHRRPMQGPGPGFGPGFGFGFDPVSPPAGDGSGLSTGGFGTGGIGGVSAGGGGGGGGGAGVSAGGAGVSAGGGGGGCGGAGVSAGGTGVSAGGGGGGGCTGVSAGGTRVSTVGEGVGTGSCVETCEVADVAESVVEASEAEITSHCSLFCRRSSVRPTMAALLKTPRSFDMGIWRVRGSPLSVSQGFIRVTLVAQP